MRIDIQDSKQSAIIKFYEKFGKWPNLDDPILEKFTSQRHSNAIRTEKRRDILTQQRRAKVMLRAKNLGLFVNLRLSQ